MMMPIKRKNGKWYWGSKGPFDSRKKAEEVAQAALASGYKTKFIEFMKENGGDGGGEGGAFTSADVGTSTYGSNRKKKKKRGRKLRKAKDTMFVSTIDADRAFSNDKEKLKNKTGVERADKFLNEFSPEMKAVKEEDEEDEKEVRRKLPNVGMGISSRDSSTIPTHSHSTGFNKSFVVDLVKWVTMELRKDGDPYGVRRLDNEVPTRPYHKDEQARRKKKGDSPTTQDTVPHIPNPNDGMRNMGISGSMEDSKPGGAGTPASWAPGLADITPSM